MADKAAEVMAQARTAFAQYRQQQNQAAVEEGTFVAGFMAGYLMGFAEGMEDDVFGRVVGKMLSHQTSSIAISHEARKYTLTLRPA